MKDPCLADAQTMREAKLCSAVPLCVASHIFYQIGKNVLLLAHSLNINDSNA